VSLDIKPQLSPISGLQLRPFAGSGRMTNLGEETVVRSVLWL
jgi:hypothetical protein